MDARQRKRSSPELFRKWHLVTRIDVRRHAFRDNVAKARLSDNWRTVLAIVGITHFRLVSI